MGELLELLLWLVFHWRVSLCLLVGAFLGWLVSTAFPLATGLVAFFCIGYGVAWDFAKDAREQTRRPDVRPAVAIALWVLVGLLVGAYAMSISGSFLGGYLGIAGALLGAMVCQSFYANAPISPSALRLALFAAVGGYIPLHLYLSVA